MNWIRICKRLTIIDKYAPFYRSSKIKWTIFNRWLKYAERYSIMGTPGFGQYLKKRMLLYPDLDKALAAEGFVNTVYYNNHKLLQALSQINNILNRWKSFTQESIFFRILGEKFYSSAQLRLLRRIFAVLRTNLRSAKELSIYLATQPKPFRLRQLEIDIDHIKRRFLTHRRKGLAHLIGSYTKKFIRGIAKDGKESFSFKKFIIQFKHTNALRVSCEQRLLVEAFQSRGSLEYVDVTAPPRNDPIVPLIMSKVDGKSFSDPLGEGATGRTFELPPGFKISKVRLVFLACSIVGWQLVWSADMATDIESPKRGDWNSAGISLTEVKIPKYDFIIGVEYYYDGAAIQGIRFKLFFGGFTKWSGGKASFSTLSVYYGTEIAPRQDFEDYHAEYLKEDEKNNPAMPLEYVVGFTGIITKVGSKTSCLGLVVRKVKKQDIFSYYWVEDALRKQRSIEESIEPLYEKEGDNEEG